MKTVDLAYRYIANCQPMTELFKDETESFNEKNRAICVEQILRALNYMHTNNLVHRDIKTENVVYAAEGQ